MKKPKGKIIKIDYDNTIDNAVYPHVGDISRICIITILELSLDNYIILDTCRKGYELQQAVRFMKSKGLEFDYVNENCSDKIREFGDTRKIYADISIDDKNLFTPLLKNKGVDWLRVRESLGLVPMQNEYDKRRGLIDG